MDTKEKCGSRIGKLPYLSLLTDMLDASASKLDAEMRLVNARVDVLYYYFQLKYISGVI